MDMYLYPGTVRDDSERGKLTLVRNPETQLSFGESTYWWETEDGARVQCTDDDMAAIQRARYRNVRAEYDQQVADAEYESWGEGARREMFGDR